MTWQSETRAWALSLAGVAALSGIAWKVWTMPPIPNLAPVVQHLDAATGAWAAASKQQAQSVTAIERDVRVELWQVDRTLGTLDTTLSEAQGAIGSVQTTLSTINAQAQRVGPLLDSATKATDAIPSTLNDLDSTESAATASLNDFDTLLRSPSLSETMTGLGKTSTNAGKISGDLYVFEHKYLNPPPCKTRKCKWGRVLSGFGPLIGIGSEGVNIYHAFQPMKVQVTNLR